MLSNHTQSALNIEATVNSIYFKSQVLESYIKLYDGMKVVEKYNK